MEKEQDELERMMEEGGEHIEATAHRLAELYQGLEDIDGPEAVRKALAILEGLQFSASDLALAANELSGGWQQRLALAQALFVRPDVLLLDEPTNHMDMLALDWLSRYLVATQATAVIVSHDPHFLEQTCTDVVSVEHERLVHTAGGYEAYRSRSEQRERHDEAVLAAAEEKEARLSAAERRQERQERSNLQCSFKAQQKAQQAHSTCKLKTLASRGQLKAATGLAQRRKAAAERTLRTEGGEKLTAAEARTRLHARRTHERSLAFRFTLAPPLSGTAPLVRFDNVDVARTGRGLLLEQVTLGVELCARIAVIGANGAGKSTLIEALVGYETSGVVLSSGNAIYHPHLRTAYVRQNHLEQLHGHLEQTAVEYVMSRAACASELEARKLLGSVSMGEQHRRTVRELSGGERVRLILAAEVLPCQPHLIVLDEPTNHLDQESLEALVVGLESYDGAVVCISHHRPFVASFATTLWFVSDGRVHVRNADDGREVEALIERMARRVAPSLPATSPTPAKVEQPVAIQAIRQAADEPQAVSATPQIGCEAVEQQATRQAGDKASDEVVEQPVEVKARGVRAGRGGGARRRRACQLSDITSEAEIAAEVEISEEVTPEEEITAEAEQLTEITAVHVG